MTLARDIRNRSAATCGVVLAAERADLRSALRLFVEPATAVEVVADVTAPHDLLAAARRSSPRVARGALIDSSSGAACHELDLESPFRQPH
jgi:hypothetical protein